jgi:CheY-like chemotaxis protein
MLAYAGKGQFVIEPIDLSNLVACTTELARTLIPDSVKLRLEIASDLPPIESDNGQIQQVIMNLLMNAVESIPDNRNGSVVVGTWFQKESAANEVDVWGQPLPPGPYAVLEVSDTGAGMNEEIRSKMFDPFFTTKFMGRGLGLAAVQGIVRSNRGGIQVRSELGEGTTFRVFFPVKIAAPRHGDPKVEESGGRPKCTVLVIDDEAVVRKVVQVTLLREGFDVLCAESGLQGLDIVVARPDISAVILDWSMPDMSGEEVLAELHKSRGDLPVIVCSGFNEDDVRRQFEGQQLAGVIPKPFTAQQLSSKVREIVGRYVPAVKGRAQ